MNLENSVVFFKEIQAAGKKKSKKKKKKQQDDPSDMTALGMDPGNRSDATMGQLLGPQ